MTYVNVGAYIVGHGRPTTKRQLREAVAATPDLVSFDSTSFLGPHAGETLTVQSVLDEPGLHLSVVGPDPERVRKWYATVEAGPKGVTVK